MTIRIYNRKRKNLIACVTSDSAWVCLHAAGVFALSIYRWEVSA